MNMVEMSNMQYFYISKIIIQSLIALGFFLATLICFDFSPIERHVLAF